MWNGIRGVAHVKGDSCRKSCFLRWATTDGVWGSKAVDQLASCAWDSALELARKLNVSDFVDKVDNGRVFVEAAKEMMLHKDKLSEHDAHTPLSRSRHTKMSAREHKKRPRSSDARHDVIMKHNEKRWRQLEKLEELTLKVRQLNQALVAVDDSTVKLRRSILMDRQVIEVDDDSIIVSD
jgi:high-affinity K+ transport system ATPase subunit B